MVLRFYSCLFSLLAGLVMTGISLLLLLSGAKNFKLDMLPYWKGEVALYGLLVLGVLGIVSGLLAMRGKIKLLLLLYCLVLFVLLVYGYFISPVYRFQGRTDAWNVTWLTCAALVAVIGAWMQFGSRRRS